MIGYRFKIYGTDEGIYKTNESLWNYSPTFLNVNNFSQIQETKDVAIGE